MYVHVLMCNFVSYFVCVILCIFVFLCDILLPSGAINDDEYCAGTGRDGNETLRVWVEMEIKYTGVGMGAISVPVHISRSNLKQK